MMKIFHLYNMLINHLLGSNFKPSELSTSTEACSTPRTEKNQNGVIHCTNSYKYDHFINEENQSQLNAYNFTWNRRAYFNTTGM